MQEPRRGKDFSQELAEKGWYHSFELPDGTRIEGYNQLDTLRKRYTRFPIPEDLTGKRVLDIGAWDGWFSFEAERHGAAVTAIDCVEVPNFLEIQKKLGSRVSYRLLDFYELPEAGLGVFDFVFCLGILYHLKHPLLALEIVCALTTDTAIVESFVTDANTWREHQDEVPTMEFYETDELGNQLDNWIGPSVSCLMAMCRAAGFARVEFLHTTGFHAGVVCHRKWEPVPAETQRAAPELLAAMNTRTLGVNFSTRKEEYITCWFRTTEAKVTRDQLRLEVADFGVPALYVRPDENGTWIANFRLPPGSTQRLVPGAPALCGQPVRQYDLAYRGGPAAPRRAPGPEGRLRWDYVERSRSQARRWRIHQLLGDRPAGELRPRQHRRLPGRDEAPCAVRWRTRCRRHAPD